MDDSFNDFYRYNGFGKEIIPEGSFEIYWISMINIEEKYNCCGCGACAQKCPKQCITLKQDSEGFLYPEIDTEKCIDCGLCEKVCPVLNPYQARNPLQTFAAINKDEKIRLESSSGGIFTLLAEFVISQGGVVFGARYDEEWQVTLDYTESVEGLAAFRGSKYVQARTGETYKQCEKILKDGRKVLFSGTPCQIAGLKHFLCEDYDNLLAVECICHSAPSQLVWRKYLEQHRKGRKIKCVNFRDKTTGWSKYKYSLVIEYENGEKDVYPSGQPYMCALVSNLITRPSCSACKAREGMSGADISLGDFWGIWDIYPEFDDNKGTTLIVVYSEKGIAFLKDKEIKVHKASIIDARKYNEGLSSSKSLHNKRDLFFSNLPSTMNVDALIENSLRITLFDRVKRLLRIK